MHRATSLNPFLTVPAFKYSVKIWFKIILMMILDWYFPWSRDQNYQLTSITTALLGHYEKLCLQGCPDFRPDCQASLSRLTNSFTTYLQRAARAIETRVLRFLDPCKRSGPDLTPFPLFALVQRSGPLRSSCPKRKEANDTPQNATTS